MSTTWRPAHAQPSQWERIRRRVHRGINHPLVDIAIVALIAMSIGLIVAEVAFDREAHVRTMLRSIGDLITWTFVVELSIRFIVAPKKSRFFHRYWIDIIAVLPLARPLRLLRVLYLLRLFRAGVLLNRRLSSYGGIVAGTFNEISFLATLTLTIVLVAASTVHLGPQSVALDMEGFEGSLWFALYTLVGGEPIGGLPANDLGRAVTLVLMLGGLTVFGMFIGTISASMVTVFSKRMEVRAMHLEELSDHVVVCGWNHAGPAMLRELLGRQHTQGRSVVVVTEHDEMPSDVPGDGIRQDLLYHVKGDYTRVEMLDNVGIDRASLAIILTDIVKPRTPEDQDARAVLAALSIERMGKGIFCCTQLNNEEHSSLLRMAGVEEIVIGDWYTGMIIGSVGRTGGLVAVLNDILTSTGGNSFHKVRVPKKWKGKTVGEAHQLLKSEHQAILVSVERAVGTEGTEVNVNPEAGMMLEHKDVLVVISEKSIRL